MRRRSSSSADLRFFKLDYEKVMAELKAYAERAVARGARAVVLIGSLSRGDYTAFSDADLVILVDRAPANPLDRLYDYLDPTLSVDVEPRVYTIDEFMEMAKHGSRLASEVITHGKLLAGDAGIIERAKLLAGKRSINEA